MFGAPCRIETLVLVSHQPCKTGAGRCLQRRQKIASHPTSLEELDKKTVTSQ